MKYERILAAIASDPWAIEPIRGQQIADILTRRLSGDGPDPAGIAAAREAAADRQRRKARQQPQAVGLIPLYGVMTKRADFFTEVSGVLSTDQVGQAVDQMAADPTVEAIVLDVDSPGGSVYGVEQLALKVRAATAKKKVIAVANSLAASAAYWVASQASELVVVPDGEVGSVGVYVMHQDVSRAADAAGVKVTFIKAGKNKVAGNPYEPLGPDGAAEIQRGVDDFYDLFVRAVARGRNVSLTRVREGFGQGGMVRAKAAVAEGMADKVGTLDDVLARYGLTTAQLNPAASAFAELPTVRPAGQGRATDPGVEIRRRRLQLDQDAAHLAGPAAKPVAAASWRSAPNLEYTAFHEAGHAVVAHLLGDHGVTATVVPGPGYLGRIVQSRAFDPIGEATIRYAGVEGGRLSPTPSKPGAGYPGSDDDEQADRLCPYAEGQRIARKKAREMVSSHARAVREVARQLVARGTVGAADVAAAVEQFPPRW